MDIAALENGRDVPVVPICAIKGDGIVGLSGDPGKETVCSRCLEIKLL